MIAYLAAPYSYRSKSKEIGLDITDKDKAIREKRFNLINKTAAALFEAGVAVFSPISMSHPIAQYMGNSGKFEDWADFDYDMLLRCDMLIVLCIDGWKDSKGVFSEIDFANSKGKPILYMNENLKIVQEPQWN